MQLELIRTENATRARKCPQFDLCERSLVSRLKVQRAHLLTASYENSIPEPGVKRGRG